MTKKKQNKTHKKKKSARKQLASDDIALMHAFSQALQASIAHDEEILQHYAAIDAKALGDEMQEYGIMMDEEKVLAEYAQSSTEALVRQYEAKYQAELSAIGEDAMIDQACIRYYIDKLINSHFAGQIPADPERIMQELVFFDRLEVDQKPKRFYQVLNALNEMAKKQPEATLEEMFQGMYFDCESSLELGLKSIVTAGIYDPLTGYDIAREIDALLTHYPIENEDIFRSLTQKMRVVA